MDVSEVAQIKEMLAPVEDVAADESPEVVEQVDNDDTVTGEVVDDSAVEEDAAKEAVTTDEAASEDPEKYTVKTFAEAVGWDVDQIYSDLTIPMDNGDNIPLGEFKNNHQNLVRENEGLKTQLQQATQGLDEVRNGANQTQQMSNEMMQHVSALQSLDKMESETDWDELESLDPTAAILQRGKIDRERANIRQSINEVQSKQQQEKQLFQQQAQAKMLELVPEWSDAPTYNKDYSAMREVMQSHGFGYNDLDNVEDPRQMALLRDYAKLLDKQKAATGAVNKVRSAPRVLKGRQPVPIQKNSKSDALINKAKQTGSKKDEHAAIKSLLM